MSFALDSKASFMAPVGEAHVAVLEHVEATLSQTAPWSESNRPPALRVAVTLCLATPLTRWVAMWPESSKRSDT